MSVLLLVTNEQIGLWLVAAVCTALIAYSMPKLLSFGNRITKLEEHKWTGEEKIKLYESLATITATLKFVRENQRDFQDTLEDSLMEAAHSPHTPELDALLDKHKKHGLTNDERLRVIKMLDGLIRTEFDRSQCTTYRQLRGVMLSNLRRRVREKELHASAAA